MPNDLYEAFKAIKDFGSSQPSLAFYNCGEVSGARYVLDFICKKKKIYRSTFILTFFLKSISQTSSNHSFKSR